MLLTIPPSEKYRVNQPLCATMSNDKQKIARQAFIISVLVFALLNAKHNSGKAMKANVMGSNSTKMSIE